MVLSVGTMSPNNKLNDSNIVVYSGLTEFTQIQVEPVGRWFEKLRLNSKCDADFWNPLEDAKSSEEEYSENDDDCENNDAYLRKLDPKDWKNQDHYAVLGLKMKRFYAKDEEIKKAYRKIVLTHHPDKRRSAGENIEDLDHDYYSCITKAYEILGNPLKRRSYDSVDPEFDDDIPPLSNYSKENFFECFQPVVQQNARWSVKQPVPCLGDTNSTVDEVGDFYNFWYNFESWREFSYLDEEEKEKGESREERKWIEKQNKAARQRLKKEEMSRIRELVDNAYACDPRIIKFKEEEKRQKLAQKKAKQDAVRLKAEEEEKKKQQLLENERKIKEKEEEKEKLKREREKKEKDALKKLLKKERKILQKTCEKYNFFSDNEEEKIKNLKDLDKLLKLLPLDKLKSLNSVLETTAETDLKKLFLEWVAVVEKQLEEEKEQMLASMQRSSLGKDKNKNDNAWSHEELQLLVKAVNLFPAGTNNRWEAISLFMAQHSLNSVQRSAKHVLEKAKELQKQSFDLKDQVNKNAFENLEKNQKTVVVSVKEQSAPTERFESSAEQQGLNPDPWTSDEQQLFEQALKTFPASTAERWERISECVPGRSKKDCIRRYKELVEMVRAKKAAQATTSQKAKKC